MKKNSSANITSLQARKKQSEKLEIKYGNLGSTHGRYLTVEGAAHRMNCTPRRIRQLLQQQRLQGLKLGKDWRVNYPLTLQIAKRGPKNSFFERGTRGQFNNSLYVGK